MKSEGKLRKFVYAAFILLCFNLFSPLFIPTQKAEALGGNDFGPIGGLLDLLDLNDLQTQIDGAAGQIEDVNGNIAKLGEDMFFGDIQYVSDKQIKSKYFTYDLNESCNHDYNCYISDDPISNGLAAFYSIKQMRFSKFAIVVNKNNNTDARFTMVDAFPALQTNTGWFAPTMSINLIKKTRVDFENFIHYKIPFTPGGILGVLGLPVINGVGNRAAASNILSVRAASPMPTALAGEIVFPPEEEIIPIYINGFSKDIYVSFGIKDSVFGFTDVQYKEADRRLAFLFSRMDEGNNLYTKTDYTIKLRGGGGTVDCTTGSFTIISPCGVEYTGEITFNLSDDGKITVINPKEGEDINNGKKVNLITAGSNTVWIRGASKISSPLDKALSATIKWLAGIVETGLSVTMNWVDSLLNETDDYVLGDGSPDSRGVEPAWTKIRNIALTLLVLALIIIAFANVFQVNIEQYGLNRIIPKIIVAIIMAYLSWVFVLFFFDVANVIQAQAYSLLGSGSGLEVLGSVSIATPDSADIMAKIGAIIVLIILLFGVWVCGIVLLFLLLLRIVMLSFLLAIAPLAMIANIMPFTANQYKRWWNEFFKWMFMGPMATAILALGMVIATNTGFGTTTEKFDANIVSDAANPGSGVNLLVGLLIFGASMYMAATLPLKWGGSVMGKWANAGKKLWGGTGGKVVGGASALAGMAGKGIWESTKIPGGLRMAKGVLVGRDALKKQKEQRWAQDTRAKIAQSQLGRTFITGGDETDARNAADAAIAGHQTRLAKDMDADPSKAVANILSAKDGSFEQIAGMRALGDAGKLDMIGAQAAKSGRLLGTDGNPISSEYSGVSFVDEKTGGWVDKEMVKRAHFDGNDAGYTQWLNEYKAAKKAGNDFTMREVAGVAMRDRKTQEAVMDKNMGIAMVGANAENKDSAEYRLYRGAVSKQMGKSGKDMHHDFVAEAKDEDFEGVTAKNISDMATKATAKTQKSLARRYQNTLNGGEGPKLSREQFDAYQRSLGLNDVHPQDTPQGPPPSTPPGSNWTEENQTRFDG